MLFNSAIFLFVFLPIVVTAYYALARRSALLTIYWLLLASLIFYAWWHPPFVAILIASIVVNFGFGRLLERGSGHRSIWLAVGLVANIGLLAYFKYSNFLVANLNATLHAGIDWPQVVLPIGISFYTLQQIAFLVDTYHYGPIKRSFSAYALFVSFFPHSIAGPIVNPREVIPQFGRPRADRWADFSEGLVLFVIGLTKKMLIADTFAVSSTAMFNAAGIGADPTLFEAWNGVLCYTLQIYFDFSGYSDMAIGLARMFGVDLPINFASPYKARSIIDFWRRWHITLSRFLRDYLYIPLGGNRHGRARQKLNVMVTMLLGGLWHGASWNFLIWGGMHGVFLLINHAWQEMSGNRLRGSWLATATARALTLLCVIVAWVPFRAVDLDATWRVWRGMAGLNGVVFPEHVAAWLPRLELPAGNLNGVSVPMAMWLLLGLAVAMWGPNSHEIMRDARLGTPTKGYPATIIAANHAAFQPRAWMAVAVGVMIAFAVLKLNDISEFIYFQF